MKRLSFRDSQRTKARCFTGTPGMEFAFYFYLVRFTTT